MFSPEFTSLVPNSDNWPLFDEVLVHAFESPAPSDDSLSSPSVTSDTLPPGLPSAATLAAMPVPPSRSSPRNKNPDHIPRPRNAFMLFRSAFAAAQKITSNVEHDNRHITRVIAHCWHRLSDTEKQVWRDKAAAEKAAHAVRYPNYRFSPVCRASRPVKRNVRRNGTGDVKRCETLAELVMSGKHGSELESAIKKFDREQKETIVAPRAAGERKTRLDLAFKDATEVSVDVPPFLSPLLPPTTTVSCDEGSFFQCASNVQVEPPQPQPELDPFYSGTFEDLFTPPSYQYYQPDALSSMPCPRSIPSPDRRVMDLVQNNHAELLLAHSSIPADFALFSWNQSEDFSFYH